MSEEPRFIVYTSGYNCSQYVEKCLASVANQTYKNYLHLIVDDSSTDDTHQQCLKYKNSWAVVKKTPHNLKWLNTAVDNLKPKDDEIIVTLDLDDTLYDNNVLEKLAKIYRDEKAWLTYGSYVRTSKPDQVWNHCRAFPQDILDARSFRSYSWLTSHLRSFKGFLWNNIKREDFKDWNGVYADMAYDVAIMMPMLEMCKPNKIRYIPDAMYYYNDYNPLNDHKRDVSLQMKTDTWFRHKPTYPVLSNYL